MMNVDEIKKILELSEDKYKALCEKDKQNGRKDATEQSLYDRVIDTDISLVAIIGVDGGNPNASPADGMPRSTIEKDGVKKGMISQVCLNHHIRVAMSHAFEGVRIFTNAAQKIGSAEVQLIEDESTAEKIQELTSKAGKNGGKKGKNNQSKNNGNEEDGQIVDLDEESINKNPRLKKISDLIQSLCNTYEDLHLFGMTGIVKDETLKKRGFEDPSTLTFSFSGPVKFNYAKTLMPLEVERMDIAKSYNGIDSDKDKSSDTLGGAFWMVKSNVYCANLFISQETCKTYRMTYGDLFILMGSISEMFRHNASAGRTSNVFYIGQVVAATSSDIIRKVSTNALLDKVTKILYKKFDACGCDVLRFASELELTEEEGFKTVQLDTLPTNVDDTFFYKVNGF